MVILISRVFPRQDVYLKTPDSIVPALTKLPKGEPTLCIDSTTLDVDVAREVAKSVEDAGAMMIDAPVSGGLLVYSNAVPHILTIFDGAQVLLEQKPLRSRLWLEGHSRHSLWPNPTSRSWVLEVFTAALLARVWQRRSATIWSSGFNRLLWLKQCYLVNAWD